MPGVSSWACFGENIGSEAVLGGVLKETRRCLLGGGVEWRSRGWSSRHVDVSHDRIGSGEDGGDGSMVLVGIDRWAMNVGRM